MQAVAPIEVSPNLPRIPGWVGDVAAGLLICSATFGHFPGVTGERTFVGYCAALLPVALLPLRHYLPHLVLGLCVLCFDVAALSFPITPFSALACSVAVYSIAVRMYRKAAVSVAAATIAATFPVAVVAQGSVIDPLAFQVVVLVGFAAAVGEAVRIRRAYIAEITARAIHAEDTREAEASRRVAEDRLRIARDLHDAVAHQITVISLNAGVASSTIETRPTVARESLLTIREAARGVLSEIGDLLATLRTSDRESLTRPTPVLEHLTGLIQTFESSGLKVSSHVERVRTTLAAAEDVVAYRVVQEGLTNALRHGTGRAHLVIAVRGSEVELSITNPVGPERAGRERLGSGLGLAGLEERVSSVGGRSSHGLRNGVFRLDVALPVRGRSPESGPSTTRRGVQ